MSEPHCIPKIITNRIRNENILQSDSHFRVIIIPICTATGLLKTRARVSPVHTPLIPTDHRHCIRRRDFQRLLAVTRKYFQLDGLILLHLSSKNLRFHAWLANTLHLAEAIKLKFGNMDVNEIKFGIAII